MKTILPLLLSAAVLSGCATATRGTKEKVTIQYSPADAEVVTSLGDQCPASPCELKISRKKAFSVTAKAKGFQPETVRVETRVAASGVAVTAAGNALAGGIVGIVVDTATGAALEHHPNPVIIKLVPEGQEKPVIPVDPKDDKPSIAPTS